MNAARKLHAIGNSAVRIPGLIYSAIRAWRTLEPKHWADVAERWGPIARIWPSSHRAALLYARLLRTARRPYEAVEIGNLAASLRPEHAGTWRELGLALRQQGRREDAIAAFAKATRLGHTRAVGDLCRYGARAFLPDPALPPHIWSLQDYARYAADNPPPPAPASWGRPLFRVIPAEASQCVSQVRAMLSRQTYQYWCIHGDEVAGQSEPARIFDLPLPSGSILDPQALAWLAWAIIESGCSIVRADHDHLSPDGMTRQDPVLLPQPDRLWTEGRATMARLTATAADSTGPVAHIPLVLMTMPGCSDANDLPAPDADPISLSIIIPTRDNPDLLREAVDTLLAMADMPEMIEIIIVDNDSRAPSTRQLFSELARRPAIKIIPFPETFNWSRANNLGASHACGDALLFLNDDTAMRTPGWDRILAALLKDPETGIIGARMLYPDDTIQHGGFVFGMDNGPQHEGRWMPGDYAGPSRRWIATRQAAAITGAFMAIRGVTFLAAGGFDETNFSVDFADVDLCLRLRSHRLAVVYCGAITLLHHESVSRGLNLSRRQRTRMRQEHARLRARWGQAVDEDPGYHPAWSRIGCSYDGLHRLTLPSIMEHVRRGASENPYWIEDKSKPGVNPDR